MKQQLPTVSIGIPAFNEGKNIYSLLHSLLKQKELGYQLREIIIASDGSDDDTVAQVKRIASNKVKLINSKKRLGKSARLQQIFSRFSSDNLVVMDADVMIKDTTLLAKAVEQADIGHTGIAGVNAIPFASDHFFVQTLETGVEITKSIAQRWNKGNNYLSFRGCFLMLDGTLARNISMPKKVVNNDSYLYFAAKEQGYTPVYLPQCEVYFRSPNTMEDHVKQSSRFKTSQSELHKYFNLNWDKEYKLPFTIVAVSILQSMVKKPIHTVSYIVVNFIASLQKQTNISSAWSIAGSTK